MRKISKPAGRDIRSMFSIGQESADQIAYLAGRMKKADGTYATSRSDAVRELIRVAYEEQIAREKSPKKRA